MPSRIAPDCSDYSTLDAEIIRDAAALADHPSVLFNYYRGGLGTCAVEMHSPPKPARLFLSPRRFDP